MSSFDDIINKCKKDWDCPELMDAAASAQKPRLPFSSPQLNYSTYGGIPRNMITEFFGNPQGGKSTTAVDICKNSIEIFQKEFEDRIISLQEKASAGDKSALVSIEELQEIGPKKVLYIDLEHSFDSKWAHTLGIDNTEIEVMQPPNIAAEDILQKVQELIESGQVGLLVLDSIPSLVTKSELEKKYGERTVSALAGLMTIFLRKIVPLLARYECTMLLINQVRDNMDNPYVVSTPGGQAIKFYSALRILFKIGTPVDFLGNDLPASAENPAGYKITAKLVKQKSAPNDRRNGEYYLMSQSGIRVDIDFCQLAMKKYGIIKKGGAWMTMLDPRTREPLIDAENKPVKLNGFAKVLEYVQQHPDYFETLKQVIMEDIEANGISEGISV
jgi:recombination protein RecA